MNAAVTRMVARDGLGHWGGAVKTVSFPLFGYNTAEYVWLY